MTCCCLSMPTCLLACTRTRLPPKWQRGGTCPSLTAAARRHAAAPQCCGCPPAPCQHPRPPPQHHPARRPPASRESRQVALATISGGCAGLLPASLCGIKRQSNWTRRLPPDEAPVPSKGHLHATRCTALPAGILLHPPLCTSSPSLACEFVCWCIACVHAMFPHTKGNHLPRQPPCWVRTRS